jgi:hypothetical protein
MDPELSFCRNAVLSSFEGSRFIVLGDPQSRLSIFRILTGRIELRAPKFSSFGVSTLSSLQTQAYKCAKLTDLAGRWVLGRGFIRIQLCHFVEVPDSLG